MQLWGSSGRSMSAREQSRYYADADKERGLHMQQHPEWSANQNFGKMMRTEVFLLTEETECCSGPVFSLLSLCINLFVIFAMETEGDDCVQERCTDKRVQETSRYINTFLTTD